MAGSQIGLQFPGWWILWHWHRQVGECGQEVSHWSHCGATSRGVAAQHNEAQGVPLVDETFFPTDGWCCSESSRGDPFGANWCSRHLHWVQTRLREPVRLSVSFLLWILSNVEIVLSQCNYSTVQGSLWQVWYLRHPQWPASKLWRSDTKKVSSYYYDYMAWLFQ